MRRFVALITLSALILGAVATGLVSGQEQSGKSSKGKPATSKAVAPRANGAIRKSSGISVASANEGPQEPSPAPPQSSEPLYVPNQILVQLESKEDTKIRLNLTFLKAKERNDELKVEAETTVSALHVDVARTISAIDAKQGDLLVVNLPADKRPDDAINQLQGTPGIKYVQKNWIYTHQQTTTSDDPEYLNGSLWGMYSDDRPNAIGPTGPLPPGTLTTNEFGSQAEKAWAAGHTGSRDVYVGIIDEGVQFDHPDLAGNIWTNPGESGLDASGHDKATNGKDDDGDGLIDDIHGWDFFNEDNTVYDGGPNGTVDQHGTHVAGTIGAIGHNGAGVVGVNWNITMIPAKFLGAGGGTTDKAVEAVDYFVRLKQRGVNIVAINNSWGGGGYDLLLLEAIKRAARVGILFIVAAGNNGMNIDASPYYPACYHTTIDTRNQGGTDGVDYDSVIAVAALSSSGDIAAFSDFGQSTVALGAPGVSVLSTFPSNAYASMSGTSMATPHVTGAVALYASTHPNATPQTIRSAILSNVTPTPSLAGKTLTGGRLNVGSF